MLRTKLYLGMLPLVILLIGVSLYSFLNYKQLNSEIEEIQNRHYEAILRMDQIMVSLSQLERALRLVERGYNDELAEELAQRHLPRIHELGIDEAPADWAISQLEADLEPRIVRLESQMTNLFDRLRENGPRPEVPQSLFTLTENIGLLANRIINEHNQAIKAKSDSFKQQAGTHSFVITTAILFSLIGLGATSYFLSQRILRPIDAMTRSVDRLARDSWYIDYEPKSRDEISRLEAAFSEMAKRIHEYHQATSREIQRTRRRMKECLNNFPHPIFFVNKRRQIVYTNPSAKELADTCQWANGLPEDLMTRIESVLGTGEQLLATGFDETLSFNIENVPTHFLPLLIRIDSGENDQTECAVILQDITILRLSDELKSDLVATVSHEIRTPVTSATLALHLMLDRSLGDLTEDQEEMLNTASSDLRRLKRLLDHLLEIARLESQKPRLERYPTPPSVIVQNILEAFSTTAADKGVALSAEVEATLPLVSVDNQAIDVAVSNFLSNALKYAPSPSKITVYCRRASNNQIRIGVMDEGPGVEEEHLERVFEKFYRSSGQRKMEGIGLGLSICKEIAIAHDGSVGVENRPTGGADFFLTLPVEEVALLEGT